MAPNELDLVEGLLLAKTTVAQSARQHGRAPSTLYRKIRRNRSVDGVIPKLRGSPCKTAS